MIKVLKKLLVYIPIWTIKDLKLRPRPEHTRVYIPIWTIKDMDERYLTAARPIFFTFQYGRLKTQEGVKNLLRQIDFTFQYGRLKTRPNTARRPE